MDTDTASIFARFELDNDYGFVTNPERGTLSLPPEFQLWEEMDRDLPALTASGRLRHLVDMMPVLDVGPLLDNRLACEHAYRLLTFIAHGYVRGRLHEKSKASIPASLAAPWIVLAERLGTLPVCTYCSTVLYNYRLLDASQPLSLENVWTLTTSSGAIDESWFYIVSLCIEAQSGALIRLFIAIANAHGGGRYEEMRDLLAQLALRIGEIQAILVRMYEENIPAVFYQRVRRYLSGWLNDDQLPEGLRYGDETGEPRKYPGGSAAQSPIIQCLDIVLGVQHARQQSRGADTGVGSAGAYLVGMRKHMSRNHREFLAWLEEHINVHAMVSEPAVPLPVVAAFNECVGRLKSFRDKHLAMVSAYINVQAAKTEAKATTVKGTGGSNPVPFLREVRSHMDGVHIAESECEAGTHRIASEQREG